MQETISESWKSVLSEVQFEPVAALYISRGVISFYMTLTRGTAAQSLPAIKVKCAARAVAAAISRCVVLAGVLSL